MNRIIFAGTIIALYAAPALAAQGEPLQPLPAPNAGIATLITGLVVFVVTSIFLLTVVWPKISKGLEDRENKIKSEIEAAEMARTQAKMALDNYERSLAEARTEAQRIIETNKAQLTTQLAEMRAKADTDVAAMKNRAMTEIEAARKGALSDLYAQSATLATQVAGKILNREVSGADNQRFVNEALSKVTSNN